MSTRYLRHHVDTSTEMLTSDHFTSLPDEKREIEDPELDPVPEELLPEHLKLVDFEPYEAPPELLEAVNLAIALGRPLLLQGEPGCGKTRLAYAVAYAMKLPLEVCAIKSTSRAQDLLYTYDAVRRLYDAQMGVNENNRALLGANENNRAQSLDIHRYIHLGPLGRAIARAQHGRRSVVLIDEIDKADIDFPNDLLWELDRLEFKVTESPNMAYAVPEPALRPIVFVTHNEEKALPPAFLRRCIFYYLEFPKEEAFLSTILEKHHITDATLGKRAIAMLLKLRELDLNKKPGLSELLDWVGYLKAVQTPTAEIDRLVYIWALLKNHEDQEKAKQWVQKNLNK